VAHGVSSLLIRPSLSLIALKTLNWLYLTNIQKLWRKL